MISVMSNVCRISTNLLNQNIAKARPKTSQYFFKYLHQETNRPNKKQFRNRFLIASSVVGFSTWLIGKYYINQDVEKAVSIY